jgi:conjugative transfer region protein TrbK
MMRFNIVIRGLAYVVLALAVLATAIALNNRQYPPAGTLQVEPSSAPDDVNAELARCKALGSEAANDAGCKAVWQASREHFLYGKNPYLDRAADSLPAAANANKPAGERSSSPSDRAGRPQ